MADKYLVPCSCGRTVPAGPNQAGSALTCECGNEVEVPPLRKLRSYPQQASQETTTGGQWTARHAVTSALVALAIALGGYGLYLRVAEPDMPQFGEFYQQAIDQDAERMLAEGKPIDFWRHWMVTGPLLREQGFAPIETPQEQATANYLADYRTRTTWLLMAAGVAGGLAAVAWLALPARAAD